MRPDLKARISRVGDLWKRADIGGRLKRPRDGLRRLWGRLKQKGLGYWLSALLVFLLTIAGSGRIYQFLRLEDWRADYFQFLLEKGPRTLEPRHYGLVLIDDDAYWGPELAGRAPVNRTYLAKLVDRLVAAHANVIALDFDARLPRPDSNEIPAPYKQETCNLIGAIKRAAAADTKVVVATPIHDIGGHVYRQESDIYQANGLCARPQHQVSAEKPCGVAFSEAESQNVTCGYIALPPDMLAVPGQIEMEDKGRLDSFALAVARADYPTLVAENLPPDQKDQVRYTNYMSEERFKKFGARLSSEQVLHGPVNLVRRAVIVGAGWSNFAAGRGGMTDLHLTPIGKVVGAVLHANYAEAIVDGHALATAPEWVAHVLEIAISLGVAVWFALTPGVWAKLATLLAVIAMLFFAQWALVRQFGVFFDAFFPVLGLALHSLYERLLGKHEGGHASKAAAA
jgi:CHASE2 domain-containing sensor protein